MRLTLLAAVAIAVAACGPARSDPPKPDVGAWSERVDHNDACLDIGHCPRFAPYWHVGEDPGIGFVQWIVSEDGRACIVQPFDNWSVGEQWTCRWRNKRGI